MDQNANGRKGEPPGDRYTARFTIGTPKPIDRDGPRVIATNRSGIVAGPVDSLEVIFSEPIEPSSFTTADIVFDSPNGSITALDDPVSTDGTSTKFLVTFAQQLLPGAYSFSVGPFIQDEAGNAMDQNQNGLKGENPSDRYSTSFMIQQPRVVTVIAHGWELSDSYDPEKEWPGGMRDALINTRGLPAGDVILPNWVSQSGLTAGKGWAEATGDKVFAQAMQKIVGQPMAIQPTGFHFVGHSRGAVVISEALRRLSYFEQQLPLLGSRIDTVQMTTLDPDPSKLLNDDPDIQVWQGVDWADNYYQTSGTPPFFGIAVPGAFNLDLSAKLDSTLLRVNHSEVHDWYHWTTDTNHEDGMRDYSRFNVSAPAVDAILGTDLWYSNLPSLPGGEPLADEDDWTQVGYNWSLAGNDWTGLGNPAGDELPIGEADPGTPSSVFNGSFDINAKIMQSGKASIPGFQSNDPRFSVVNGAARLTKSRATPVYLKHDLAYIPPDATSLNFSVKRLVSSTQGVLSVLFARPEQCDQDSTIGLVSLKQINLAGVSTRQMASVSVSLSGKLNLSNAGQVGCFVFQLEGARKALRVQLDDIELSRLGTPAVDFSLSAYRADNPLWQAGFAPIVVDPPNPKLGAALGNCTWYANGRLRQLGYSASELDGLVSDANTWDNIARDNDIPTSRTPQVGSIAEWDSGGGGLGHVAVVEQVNADGTIVISESSFSLGGGAWDFLFHTRTITTSSVSVFIHVRR